jgi:ABC-type lipoprotein release transport system permease subunit
VSILAYAWRNLGRNRKRTLITLTSLAFATAVLIVSFALLDGLIGDIENNITSISAGEVQIHAPGYFDERSLFRMLDDPAGILRIVEQSAAKAAPRSYGDGLLARDVRSSGCRFWGVDPAAERKTFSLPERILAGAFLSDQPERGIVLGEKLAHSLRAGLGDELDAVVQAADGSLGNEVFTLRGILQTSGAEIDLSAAIIHERDYADLFVSGGAVHEIAVNSGGRISADRLRNRIRAAAPGADVKTWQEILPLFAGTVQNARKAVWVFSICFFLVAGLGITNTMLMATYERTREFGIMKALGTAPRRIVGMILSESALLCLCATIAGAALGAAASLYLADTGLDLGGFPIKMKMTTFIHSAVWRASLGWKNIMLPVLCIWAVCIPAALYPALTAARLDPVRTLHGRY